MEAADNEALHAYILVLAAGEPRSIVTGSWGNGLEAWQHFKNRFDPETEMTQIGVGLRALNNRQRNAIKQSDVSQTTTTSINIARFFTIFQFSAILKANV